MKWVENGPSEATEADEKQTPCCVRRRELNPALRHFRRFPSWQEEDGRKHEKRPESLTYLNEYLTYT